MFRWQAFLEGARIEYTTLGREELGVRCPFCGGADSGHHMSINTRGAGWKCWRNPKDHAGKSRTRLVKALIGCSTEEARRIVGEAAPRPLPASGSFMDQLRTSMGLQPEPKPPPLDWPLEFKPLLKGAGMAVPFWRYLNKRHYSAAEARWAAWRYNLHYAIRGPWAYRIIVPIYNRAGELVNWTGRTIVDTEPLRYKTLSRLSSRAAPMEQLLGIDWLSDLPYMHALVLCEGPFDALRVTTLGHADGIYGTCTFGLNLSDQQLSNLRSLRPKTLALAYDQGKEIEMWAMKARLVGMRVRQLELPVKDPGEFTSAGGGNFLRENLL